jgi:arylsulfatase A-like enzyme
MRRPFFLWLHVWEPHFRYLPPEPPAAAFGSGSGALAELYGRLDRREIAFGEVVFGGAVSPAQRREAVDLYDGEIRSADAAVGRLLGALRERGLYEDALVVFTADHGESLGEHGYHFEHGEYLYDVTLRIPLIARFGRSGPRGLRVAGNASILDIAPTFLTAAGVRPPPLEGRDLAAHLEGGAAPHPVSYAETGRRYFAKNPRRPVAGLAGNWTSLREGTRKLIRIPTPGGPEFELYDLSRDPGEERNLYEPGDAEARRMARDLERWQASFPPLETPSAADTPLEALDPAELDRLRSLGYGD